MRAVVHLDVVLGSTVSHLGRMGDEEVTAYFHIKRKLLGVVTD